MSLTLISHPKLLSRPIYCQIWDTDYRAQYTCCQKSYKILQQQGIDTMYKVFFGSKSIRKHCNKVPDECPLASYVKASDISALWWPWIEITTKFQWKVHWQFMSKPLISALWWPRLELATKFQWKVHWQIMSKPLTSVPSGGLDLN